MKSFSAGVFAVVMSSVSFTGCLNRSGSAVSEDRSGTRSLAGKSYCREVGVLNSPHKVENCIDFVDSKKVSSNMGLAGGNAGETTGKYSIKRGKIVIRWDGQGLSETHVRLSADGSTLTSLEPGAFVWRLKQAAAVSLAGKSFCRKIGTVNSPRAIEACLDFEDSEKVSNSSSRAAGNALPMFGTYELKANDLVITYEGPGLSRTRLTLSADGKELLDKDQTEIVWVLK